MIDVKDCGAVGDGVTNDTAAIQAALDLPGATYFPPGQYLAPGLTVPTGAKLTGDGFTVSRLIRTTDEPVITVQGGPAGIHDTPSNYGVTVEDLAVYNGAPGSATPLVRVTGSTAVMFHRVRLESYTDGAPLLEMLQLWDSRFDNCLFHGGGSNATGVGAVRLLSDAGGYRQTKETFFQGCWWESYYGPAIECARGGDGEKTQVIHFTDCKLESRYTTTEHIRLHANTAQFSGVYLTHELTAGPVVDMVSARGVYGDLRFYLIQSDRMVTPSALVSLDAGCRYVNLDVYVSEPQPAGSNVVSLANPNDPTIQVRITAERPTINGSQSKVHPLPYSTVRQGVNTETGSCQYVWAKEGRPEWSLGNPTNPLGAWEQFYLRADGVNFLRFQSDGRNPATSTRRVQVNAMLEMGSGWNAPNLLRLGQYALWVDATGQLRMKHGLPTRDDDGAPFAIPPRT